MNIDILNIKEEQQAELVENYLDYSLTRFDYKHTTDNSKSTGPDYYNSQYKTIVELTKVYCDDNNYKLNLASKKSSYDKLLEIPLESVHTISDFNPAITFSKDSKTDNLAHCFHKSDYKYFLANIEKGCKKHNNKVNEYCANIHKYKLLLIRRQEVLAKKIEQGTYIVTICVILDEQIMELGSTYNYEVVFTE